MRASRNSPGFDEWYAPAKASRTRSICWVSAGSEVERRTVRRAMSSGPLRSNVSKKMESASQLNASVLYDCQRDNPRQARDTNEVARMPATSAGLTVVSSRDT